MSKMFNWIGYVGVDESIRGWEKLDEEISAYIDQLRGEAQDKLDQFLLGRGLKINMGLVMRQGKPRLLHDIIIAEHDYEPMLRSGSRFTANNKGGQTKTYEFIGFSPFDGTGCSYIVIKNIETGSCAGVEQLWFDEAYCGRKIRLLT